MLYPKGYWEGKMKRIRRCLCLLLAVSWGGLSQIGGAQIQPEAGFYELEARNFYFHNQSYFNRLALRSSPARIWYVYQPADEEPADQPLFVFFNGGPGGATSAGLLSAYTGRNAVSWDPGSNRAKVEANPYSWTRAGNLLHIDMRTAGFSYSLMDQPQNDDLRSAEYDVQNYNPFADAGDFVWLLLDFLNDRPALRANPVVIVAESYGGIRSLVMLHLLLYYRTYGNGQAFFQDPQLAQKIQSYYDLVFPEYSGQEVPPSVITRQFGHQVLIQPAITRDYQRQIASEMLETPGSAIYQLAEETGVPYIRWIDKPESGGASTPRRIMNNIYDYLEEIDRDPYIYVKKDGYLLGYFSASSYLLYRYSTLNQLTGVDTAVISELYATARGRAYKFRGNSPPEIGGRSEALMGPVSLKKYQSPVSEPAEDELSAVFGLLQPWDGYFVDLNNDISSAFYYNRGTFYGLGIYYTGTPRYGRMFLEDVAWVHTFVTNAAYDVVVFCPALPAALGLHTEMLYSAQLDTLGPPAEPRPGEIRLQYLPSVVPGTSVQERVIRFPRYSHSGHAVTLTEPEELLLDVISWLKKTGLTVSGTQGDKQ